MSNIAIVQHVSDVLRAKQLLPEVSAKKAIETLVCFKVEACSEYQGKVVASGYHPLVAAVLSAFHDHRPLVLSPDMLWLLIAQGLAQHVNTNSEDMRPRFVQHEGKEKLIVRRDDFVKGSPDNPWNEVFEEFSVQIKKHIGEDNHTNIVISFSTTGMIEKAANEIVLMDSLKNYFEYEFHTLCGIPEVKLEGTTEDWRKLLEHARILGSRHDLAWWTNCIEPILERIAKNAAGANDPVLWENIIKFENMSGGPYINGWLIDFFPYFQTSGFIHKESKELVDDWQEVLENREDYREVKIEKRNWLLSHEDRAGITTESLPGSLCAAPFKWMYFDRQYDMEFIAGFIGYTQNTEDLAVRPKIGWAVREV